MRAEHSARDRLLDRTAGGSRRAPRPRSRAGSGLTRPAAASRRGGAARRGPSRRRVRAMARTCPRAGSGPVRGRHRRPRARWLCVVPAGVSTTSPGSSSRSRPPVVIANDPSITSWRSVWAGCMCGTVMNPFGRPTRSNSTSSPSVSSLVRRNSTLTPSPGISSTSPRRAIPQLSRTAAHYACRTGPCSSVWIEQRTSNPQVAGSNPAGGVGGRRRDGVDRLVANPRTSRGPARYRAVPPWW